MIVHNWIICIITALKLTHTEFSPNLELKIFLNELKSDISIARNASYDSIKTKGINFQHFTVIVLFVYRNQMINVTENLIELKSHQIRLHLKVWEVSERARGSEREEETCKISRDCCITICAYTYAQSSLLSILALTKVSLIDKNKFSYCFDCGSFWMLSQ